MKVLAYTLAALALVAAPAHASTIGVQGTTLTFTAGDNETNRVSVSASGESVSVTDSGATPRAGTGCTLSDRTVSCPRAGLTDFVADLGDRNDRIAVSRSLALTGRIRGGSGNDALSGGGGPDELDGGTGRDTVTYSSRGDGVTVTLGGGADDGAPGERDDVMAVETLIGTSAADVLTGGRGGERLEGVAGDDRIDGGDGGDVLVGGTGRDAMGGGDGGDVFLANRTPDGADVMQGGSGSDRADYQLRTTGVVADADGRADDGQRPGGRIAFTDPLPSPATLSSSEGDLVQPDVETIRGSALEDVLGAAPGGGRLEGLAGTDALFGGQGTDNLQGGSGFDRLVSRDGRADTIVCGSQVDRVHADSVDTPNADCETVLRSFAVSLAPVARTVSPSGTLQVRVACPPQASVRCVGAVRTVTLRRLRTTGGRSRARILGSARFNVPAGASADVTLTLTQAGRDTLSRLGGATRVRLVARGRDEAGPARPVAVRFILRAG